MLYLGVRKSQTIRPDKTATLRLYICLHLVTQFGLIEHAK